MHGLCLQTFRWPHLSHLNMSVVACPASVPRWHSRFIFFSIASRSCRFSSVASSCQRAPTRSWPNVSGLGRCSEGRPARYSTVSHGIPCRMRSWLPAPRPPISHLGTEAHKRHRVQRVIRGREDVRSQLAIRFEVEIHLHAPCSPLYVVREGRPAVRCSLMPCCHVIYCLVYLRTRRSSRGSLYPFQVERHLPAVTRHTARHGVERWERVNWLCALAEARRPTTGRRRQNETVHAALLGCFHLLGGLADLPKLCGVLLAGGLVVELKPSAATAVNRANMQPIQSGRLHVVQHRNIVQHVA